MFYENEAVALVLDKMAISPSTASIAMTEPPTPNPRFAITISTDHEGVVSQTAVPKTAVPKTAVSQAGHSHHLGHGHTHRGHHHPPRQKSRHAPLLSVLVNTAVEAPDDEGELARCLVNFSSVELHKIKGLRSNKFTEVLGFECDPEVAHRQNIIFVSREIDHYL